MDIGLRSSNPEYDETFLQNYANIHLIPEIIRIKGVGKTMCYGLRDYSMRIWIKPDRIAAYRLTPAEVMQAVSDQNRDAAPGSFGESSGKSFEYTMTYRGKLVKMEEFVNIVVQFNENSSVIYLKDVANVKQEALN